ncbi:DUF3021 family protein [Planococcus versutus]|uniref:DUF3021 domain-containing protein n=1 Tax=Planococcus versutus TaxID=1302659 RepID=A0A1B1RZ37_9BACL|nr:DUF3021 family protein [Planococcus versutus]ANU26228.1 hypothetical protein I858_004180 [Planococcus versutus]
MVIFQVLLRGGIPLVIMGGIALLLYLQGQYRDAESTFWVSLISFFVGATSVIYSIDRWSLTKQSIIHFCIMLVTVLPILLFSGWFEISTGFDVLKVFCVFLLSGIGLWSFFIMSIKLFSRH